MEKNVGGYDRAARIVLGPALLIAGGAALAGLVTFASGTVGLGLAGGALIVGAILTVTAVTQKCPLNALLGMNTYRGSAGERSASEEIKASPK
jgi:hypothetical protein